MAGDDASLDILVMGAGTIGSFIGGSLAASGVRVGFVGRPRVLGALALQGLTLTDLDGRRTHVPPAELRLYERVPADIHPALVLLAVKSGATAEAAAELAAALPPGTPVVSLQNGVANARVAAEAGPGLRVLPAMVPYNVAEVGPAAFHRGTEGRLAAQDDAALRPWVAVFERAGVPIDLHADLLPVQWGKLLFNLNNPVNALSGLPLREELLERGYRRCFGPASRRPNWAPCRRTRSRRSCGCRRRSSGWSRRACCASTPRRARAWPTTWRWAGAPRSTCSAARWCGWPRATAWRRR
jgi:2-dehydropantoate 2-reductase